MDQQQFYHYLDLPKPPFQPDQVATEDLLFRRIADPAHKIRLLQTDGSYQNLASYTRLKPIQSVTDWILDLIPELDGHIKEVGIQLHKNSNNGNGQSAELPVHTDGKRGRHILCYFYNTGGSKPETVWWQEQGQPLYRDAAVHNINEPNVPDGVLGIRPQRKIDQASLTELQRASFEPHRWAIFRSDVLHSLHGVETERVALTVGFSSDEIFNMLVDKYGLL